MAPFGPKLSQNESYGLQEHFKTPPAPPESPFPAQNILNKKKEQQKQNGPETGSRRAGRGLKMFLEAVGFILAKFEPKRSHGDPIRDIFRANFKDAISRNT